MKYIVFFMLSNVAQYACESNETNILDSKTLPSNSINIIRNKHIRDIDDCQKPSFANYTIGKKRFISVDDDTFKEYLKMVDLTIFDGLPDYDDFKNWTFSEELINDFPNYLTGYDSENRPIFLSELGKHQIVKYALSGRKKQAMVVKIAHYGIYKYLKAMAFKSTKENPVHEFIEILDFGGVKPETVLTPAALKLTLKIFNLFQNFNSKCRFKGVLFNGKFSVGVTTVVTNKRVNQIVEIGFNVFRSFGVLRRDKKFVVYGTDRAFWIPKFVQMFGKYQLPEKYGGCRGFLPTYVV